MSRRKRERTGFELAVLAVSVLALTSIFVGLLISGVTGPDGPPDLRATIRATGEQRSGGDLYLVSIRNEGGQTAENVVIEATLGDETREAEILSVAKSDEEEVTIVFPTGTAGQPLVRVLSYHATTRG